jgi:hypothetical protein
MNELEQFPEPRTLSDAQELVRDAQRLLMRAEEIHDFAMAQAIRLAGNGRHPREIAEVLRLSPAQVHRYQGLDDPAAPYSAVTAAEAFLRLLPIVPLDDISWIRKNRTLIEPGPAVRRAAGLSHQAGKPFPYTVRQIGEGLLARRLVEGSAPGRSTLIRTRNGRARSVWSIETVVLEDLEFSWDPDFDEDLAAFVRAVTHKPQPRHSHDPKQPTTTPRGTVAAARQFLELLGLDGLRASGMLKGERCYLPPKLAVEAAQRSASRSGVPFVHTSAEIAAGLRDLNLIEVGRDGKSTVGRRIEGKLTRVWDLDLNSVSALLRA